MELANYLSAQIPVSLDEFMEKNINEASSFDFLSQGENPAETPLAKAIYRNLFPWYDEQKQVGILLNTYQLAVKLYYHRPFEELSDELQAEVVQIISDSEATHGKFYTSENLLTYDEVTSTGKTLHHLSDNHMLGNFLIMPRDPALFEKMTKAPYNSFFDEFLELIFNYYHGETKRQDDLFAELTKNAAYFANFPDINAYVEDNFLQMYYHAGDLLPASALTNFATYFSYVKYMVYARGAAMFQKLQLSLLDDDPDYFRWSRIAAQSGRLIYFLDYQKKLKKEFADGVIDLNFYDNR